MNEVEKRTAVARKTAYSLLCEALDHVLEFRVEAGSLVEQFLELERERAAFRVRESDDRLAQLRAASEARLRAEGVI